MNPTESTIKLEHGPDVLGITLVPLEARSNAEAEGAFTREDIRRKIQDLNEQLAACSKTDAELAEQIDVYTSKVDMGDYMFSLSVGMVSGIIGAFSESGGKIERWGSKEYFGLAADAFDSVQIFLRRFNILDKEYSWYRSFFARILSRSDRLKKLYGKVESKVDVLWTLIVETSHEASLIGLTCAVFIQLYRWQNEHFVPADTEKKSFGPRYLAGHDYLTGVIAGTLNWFGDCVWQYSHKPPKGWSVHDLVLGPILKAAKDVAKIPDADGVFLPTLLSGMLEQHDFGIHQTDDKCEEIARDDVMTGLNEGFVRAFYILNQLRDDVLKNGWYSNAWHTSVTAQNRTLCRMLSVSLTGGFVIHMTMALANAVSNTYYVGKFFVKLNYYHINYDHVKAAVLLDIKGGKTKRALEDERWRNCVHAMRLHQVKVAYCAADMWLSVLETQRCLEDLAQSAFRATEVLRDGWKAIEEILGQIKAVDVNQVEQKNPGLCNSLAAILDGF